MAGFWSAGPALRPSAAAALDTGCIAPAITALLKLNECYTVMEHRIVSHMLCLPFHVSSLTSVNEGDVFPPCILIAEHSLYPDLDPELGARCIVGGAAPLQPHLLS